MKNIFLIICLFANSILAQNIDRKLNRFIKEKNVKRIIKTLAADEMLGRSSKKPAEIAKASAFIENEFKSIDLSKLDGLPNFRQEFTSFEIKKDKADIAIDGTKLLENEILTFSESEKIKFTDTKEFTQITKEMGFWENFQKFNRDTISRIVLLDPFHKKSFDQAQHYYGNGRIISKKKPKSNNVIYILGHFDAKSITAEINQKIETLPMNNVVGILEGKSKKDEYIIFSGHYDHLGMIEPTAGDSIANGADDDASGVTAVIALAKYFKKMKNNERTLIFVAFTAEEIGGFGSKFFSENVNPNKVMAMINIEMIGKASKWGKNSAFMTGIEKSTLGEIMQKNLVGTPFAINKDPYPEQDLFYRSDNATLARQGVPAHSFSTDQIDTDKLYHSVDDEFESMEISNIVATIKALATATKTIVSGADTPSRINKTTVR